MDLNTSHPLYGNLKFLFCVDESNNPVDLVTPSRVFTPHANSVRGTGTWGRHFGVRRSGSTATYGTALDAFQPANNTGTLLIVTHAIPYSAASTNASLIGGPSNSDRYLPRLSYSSSATGIVGSVRSETAGATEFSAPSTTAYIGATPRMWAMTRNGETSHEIYVNGVLEVSGGKLGTNNTAGQYTYIGGTSGSATLEADIVWIAWFDKVLTPTEIADLYASLGPSNQFALVGSGGGGGTPPTGTVTISDVSPATTSALVTYGYSAADQTGFEYRVGGGAAATIGASPATISGLTASTPYSLEVRAINAEGAGAWSAVWNFTTEAEGPGNLPPSFDGPSIAAISCTEGIALSSLDVSSRFSDAESALTFSAVGSWPAGVTVSSAGVISGTPTTAGTYSGLQVRATDAGALTADSNTFSITVAAAALPSTITVTEPLKNNTGTLLANVSGVRVAVLEAATLAGVFETSGLTTSASGLLAAITDAAITTGQQYHVAIKLADGSVGITGPITAS